MKKVIYFCLPFLFFFLVSCDKQEVDPLQDPDIVAIAYATTISAGEGQEISVTVQKPTPCHSITETKESTSGNVYNFDFKLASPNDDTACADVIQEEIVKVQFKPSENGNYTINFLINGELYETGEVTVD